MDQSKISELATNLDQARLEAREIVPLTDQEKFNVTDAYRIQSEGIRLRLSRGERQVGFKMGLTSEAKRKQMGLTSAVYGVLTDRMQIPDGESIELQGSIHPKIEPEIAFLIGSELKGKITPKQALAACTGVTPALEILDSRYRGFKYFSLEDVVADNSSSSLFVIGHEPVQIRTLEELADLEIVMEANGVVAQSAKSSAISGHPVQSLVELCQLLKQTGESVPAGSIVLAGAATLAIPLEPGLEVKCRVEKLGEVSVSVSSPNVS